MAQKGEMIQGKPVRQPIIIPAWTPINKTIIMHRLTAQDISNLPVDNIYLFYDNDQTIFAAVEHEQEAIQLTQELHDRDCINHLYNNPDDFILYPHGLQTNVTKLCRLESPENEYHIKTYGEAIYLAEKLTNTLEQKGIGPKTFGPFFMEEMDLVKDQLAYAHV